MARIILSTEPTLPVFFNLDANVGEGCPNKPDDVALASYMMKLAGRYAMDPQAKTICSNTPVSNQMSPPFIQAIKSLQLTLKLPVDGRISVATKSGTYGGGQGFLIARFNYMVKAANRDNWPRIDKIPDAPTPPEVMMLIEKQLIGPNVKV